LEDLKDFPQDLVKLKKEMKKEMKTKMKDLDPFKYFLSAFLPEEVLTFALVLSQSDLITEFPEDRTFAASSLEDPSHLLTEFPEAVRTFVADRDFPSTVSPADTRSSFLTELFPEEKEEDIPWEDLPDLPDHLPADFPDTGFPDRGEGPEVAAEFPKPSALHPTTVWFRSCARCV